MAFEYGGFKKYGNSKAALSGKLPLRNPQVSCCKHSDTPHFSFSSRSEFKGRGVAGIRVSPRRSDFH